MWGVWCVKRATLERSLVETFRSDLDACVYAMMRNKLDGVAGVFFYVAMV